MSQPLDQWEEIRRQFDALPYPHLPLEQKPGDHPVYLSAHSSVIPFYLRDAQVIDTHDRLILDAGCGSGFKAMALAKANPGARVIGIDISQKSVELAQKRAEYHGLQEDIEFLCSPLEALSDSAYAFDYINCDETLYLLPNPVAGLRAMQAVLKPTGIIRVNLHSRLQRKDCYRMQALFKQLGCMQGEPADEEIAVVRGTMGSLHDHVLSKRFLWDQDPELKTNSEKVMANFLLQGDKGFTMLEFSDLLRQANLALITMVNWREWNLEKLFKNVEDLPIAIALGLADMSFEEQLHMYELLHPVHRLLDLYCGNPGQGHNRPPFEDWTVDHWQRAKIHLHPQLRTLEFRKFLTAGTCKLGTIPLHDHFPIANQQLNLDDSIAGCLYPLLEQPLTIKELGDRWRQIHPIDPATLETITPQQAFQTIVGVLTQLETAGYLLIELM
ncbi:MAG: class I SAM-dependent methyltransferase [Cyanobacteria bacterium P01_C01_bin.120]